MRLLRSAAHPRCIMGAVAFYGMLHLADRVIAGFVQCSALGCLPNGVAPW